MGVFEHFPYTNFHDLNLDWIVQELEKLTVDVRDFISINAIKYANPIQWDITSQYEKNTVVLDKDGNAYLSVKPVPAGVSLDRTEYWTNIGNFSALWESVKEAITIPDEGHETTASAPRAVNDLVWVNNKLLETTSPMIAGDTYVIGSNCRIYSMQIFLTETLEALKDETSARESADAALQQSIENETAARESADTALQQSIENMKKAYMTNIKDFGAVGDGVTDDTEAFSQAVESARQNSGAVYIPKGVFLINGFKFNWEKHTGLSFYGAGAESIIKTGATFNFVNVPSGAGIYHMTFNNIKFTNDNVTMFDLNEASNIVFNNCWFMGAVENGTMFAFSSGAGNGNENKLNNCYFDSQGKPGINMVYSGSPNFGDSEIVGTIFQGRGTVERCLNFDNTGSFNISNCHIYGVSDTGWDVEIARNTLFIAFSNCYLDSYPNRGRIMKLVNAKNVSISNCQSLFSPQCGGGIELLTGTVKTVISNYIFTGTKPPTAGIWGDSGLSFIGSGLVFPDDWNGAKVVAVTCNSPVYTE